LVNQSASESFQTHGDIVRWSAGIGEVYLARYFKRLIAGIVGIPIALGGNRHNHEQHGWKDQRPRSEK
jgi:hypothetical protein